VKTGDLHTVCAELGHDVVLEDPLQDAGVGLEREVDLLPREVAIVSARHIPVEAGHLGTLSAAFAHDVLLND
jgi:hypothetical protein